jgi:aminopeptidase N
MPFHLPESKLHYPRDRTFHVEHVKLELALDFDLRTVQGAALLRVLPLRSGLSVIPLDAKEMEIKGVKVDGTTASFSHDGRWLRVFPSEPLNAVRHEIEVDYLARPRRGVFFVPPDPTLGTELEAWTHSEAEEASFWYPCYDYPNDKSSSEIIVTVPEGYTVVSNGHLLGTKVTDKGATFHWLEEAPHSSYLNSFVASHFEHVDEEINGTKVSYYFRASRREDALRLFKHTPAVLQALEEITGVKYPYEKLAQVPVQEFIIGGMEHISAITYADYYFPDERSEEDFATSYARPQSQALTIIAHEVAHQWFGDLVTLKDWSHTWTNEGFAEYCEVLCKERIEGKASAIWHLNMQRQEYFEDDARRYRRPIVTKDYVHPDDMFDTVSYEKASSMIHQLRFVLGEELFFSGLNEYLTEFANKNADTWDVMNAFERISGLSLEKYFDEFFYRSGHPEFEVEYGWNPQTSMATLRVKQVQERDSMTPVFEIPCEIDFYTSTGRHTQRVEISTGDQTFSFKLNSEPSAVEFDPAEWLLKKVKFPKNVNLLRNQLTISEEPISRAAAAAELASFGTTEVLQSLVNAARSDVFWGVRVNAAESLGKLRTEAALKALLDLAVSDNRRVRRAVAKALGEYKDQRALQVLTKLLLSDPSPYVQCESAISVGKARYENAFALLKDAMKIPSPNETLAEACLEAMGYLTDHESRSVVDNFLEYGNPERARIGAMKALEHRGSLTEGELGILKRILLTDRQVRVKLALLDAVLAKLRDPRFADALWEASRADPDNRIKRRALEFYHMLTEEISHDDRFSAVEDQVQSIKEEDRKLRERIDALENSRRNEEV